MPRVSTLVLIGALLVQAASVAAQSRAPGAVPQTGPRIRDAERDRLERLGNEVARATREYRTALERQRDMYQKDAESLAELVEVRRDLFRRQIVSLREVEIAEALLAEAQAKIKETERWIQDADKMIAEATIHSELARMTLAAGGYLATGVFIRFNGTVAFSPPICRAWSDSSAPGSAAPYPSARSVRATPMIASASTTATQWMSRCIRTAPRDGR